MTNDDWVEVMEEHRENNDSEWEAIGEKGNVLARGTIQSYPVRPMSPEEWDKNETIIIGDGVESGTRLLVYDIDKMKRI